MSKKGGKKTKVVVPEIDPNSPEWMEEVARKQSEAYDMVQRAMTRSQVYLSPCPHMCLHGVVGLNCESIAAKILCRSISQSTHAFQGPPKLRLRRSTSSLNSKLGCTIFNPLGGVPANTLASRDSEHITNRAQNIGVFCPTDGWSQRHSRKHFRVALCSHLQTLAYSLLHERVLRIQTSFAPTHILLLANDGSTIQRRNTCAEDHQGNAMPLPHKQHHGIPVILFVCLKHDVVSVA